MAIMIALPAGSENSQCDVIPEHDELAMRDAKVS